TVFLPRRDYTAIVSGLPRRSGRASLGIRTVCVGMSRGIRRGGRWHATCCRPRICRGRYAKTWAESELETPAQKQFVSFFDGTASAAAFGRFYRKPNDGHRECPSQARCDGPPRAARARERAVDAAALASRCQERQIGRHAPGSLRLAVVSRGVRLHG